MLPPLFRMEDYESCRANPNNSYCIIQSHLEVLPNTNISLKKLIDDSRKNVNLYDRNFLYRTVCLSNVSFSHTAHSEINQIINKELKSYNLSNNIEESNCSKINIDLSTTDFLILIFFIAYICLVLFSTYCEHRNIANQVFKPFLSHFSLIRSWRNLTRTSRNEDFKNLLSMQGIRAFTMLGVIYTHAIFVLFLVFPERSEDVEQLMKEIKPVAYSNTYIVLPFFLLASWLETNQAYNIQEKNGKLTFKNCFILIVNRYFRMSTAILSLVFWRSNWLPIVARGKINLFTLELTQQMCISHWMYSVLFLSNYLYTGSMCQGTLWYLSADFQMYVINILIIYFTFKFKLNDYKVYAIYFFLTYILYGLTIYLYDLDIIFLPILRRLEMSNFIKSKYFLHSYTSTFSIASCSCIGLILGAIYYKNKGKELNYKSSYLLLWFITFFGLPLSVVLLSQINYNRLLTILLGPIFKPLYTFGIGIGILGMSFNLGGFVKKCFENKYIVFLSNFSFSIYVTHFICVLMRHRNTPPITSLLAIFYDYMCILIPSILIGIFVAVFFEGPLLSLQKNILPQVSIKANIKKQK